MAAAVAGDPASAEVWTNAHGQSFEANFVRLDGERVIFAFENGRQFLTQLGELSAADQLKLRRLGASAPRPVAAPKKLNFGHPWPREIRMDGPSQSRVISEDPEQKRFVYESPHYRFTCDVRLTPDVLRNFAMMFETTYKYTTALPLSLTGGWEKKGRLEILLFESMQGYVGAGGGPGTAACFRPSTGVVMAPLVSLGLEKTPTGFSLDTKGKNDVLIHELAHQLTPANYMRDELRNGWFVEGLAEYVSTTPYSWGYFRPDPHGNAARAYVTAYGEDETTGRALGTKIVAPKLQNFMSMEYREFSGPKANFNYGFALLLTHYFLHMEGNGQARRITAYLQKLTDGASYKEALVPLLGGSSFRQLEKEVADAWRKKGVEIVFKH
ncbi:hypothetical protein [Luteolibacter marinus]|uniref:hypothetical protein n=1 Tax=Luteolibacter marinus TaxID=2776705 RepID=UPI001867CE51|nr:hypothetical protein [Luteolibacter marinus]